MTYLNNNLINAANRFVNGEGIFGEVSAHIDNLVHECCGMSESPSKRNYAIELTGFIKDFEILGAKRLSDKNLEELERFKEILDIVIF